MLEEAAIRVLPFPLAQGRLGAHYRKGWEERARHGGSLIGEQVELPVRGLENRPYGDASPIPGELPASDSVPPPGSSGLDSRWKP